MPDVPIPTLTAYYKINPDENVEAAWIKIDGLRQAFGGGPLTTRTDDQWVYGGPWLEEVRHGTIAAPPGLLTALDALPDELLSGEPGWEALELLSSLAVFGVDSSSGEYRTVDVSAAGFAYLALLDILPVRHAEWLEFAAVVYGDLVNATEGEPEEWVERVLKSQPGMDAQGVRRSLIRLMQQLSWVVRRMNAPPAYKLLLRYLYHPWPEVRETGAGSLRSWECPGLFNEIRKALLLGIEDPDARTANNFLIQKLVKSGADQALPILESLRGTELDGMALRDAFRSLSKPSRRSDRRAVVHPKPIFEPDERVFMGVLTSNGEKVGIAVEPARKILPRDSFGGEATATATRASVRRSQHPAHIGHVNVLLSGRGESLEAAERLAIDLAVAIWGVDIPSTTDAVDMASMMPGYNEKEVDTAFADLVAEPSCLIRRPSASLWLVKQRDHRPYHQGLGVELALREGKRTTGSLRVYARWPDDPDGLLRAAARGALQIWRQWLEPDQPPDESPPDAVEGEEKALGLIPS